MNAFKERVIWTFWTGDNEMSSDRAKSLDILRKDSGCKVITITPDNLDDYLVEGDPLHEGYDLLSLTHKSDYLRSYFIYHYGGGYSDIKAYNYSWLPYFDQLEESEKDFIGAQEQAPDHIASDNFLIKNYFQNLASVRCFIFKPKTSFAQEWKELTNKKMDDVKIGLEVQNGSYHPRAVTGGAFQAEGDFPTMYPLWWNELLGQILHQLQYENIDSFMLGMPNQLVYNYR